MPRSRLVKYALNKLALDALARFAAKKIMAEKGIPFPKALAEIRAGRGSRERALLATPRMGSAETDLVFALPTKFAKVYHDRQFPRGFLQSSRQQRASLEGASPRSAFREYMRQYDGGNKALAHRMLTEGTSEQTRLRNYYEHLTGGHPEPAGMPIPALDPEQPKGPFMFRGLTKGDVPPLPSTFVTRHPAIAAGYAKDGGFGLLAAYRHNQFASRAGEGPHGVGHTAFFDAKDVVGRRKAVVEDAVAMQRNNPIGGNKDYVGNYEDIVHLRKGREKPTALYKVTESAEKRSRDGKGNYLPPSREWGIHVVYGPPPQDVFGIAGRA